jgi:hypothetical protein
MPSPRDIVRLPPALDALVQEPIRASETPFAVLIQEALAAYLADTPPTGTLTRADSANSGQELQGQLAALTTRVEALAQRHPTRPHARRAGHTRPAPGQDAASQAPAGVPIQTLMQEYGVSRATLWRSFA